MGLLQLIHYVRYQKDSAYKEEVDTHTQDERNRFSANKSLGLERLSICGNFCRSIYCS